MCTRCRYPSLLQCRLSPTTATCEVVQRVDSDHRLQYRLGFQECLSETARFLVDLDGAGDDMCLRLVAHLQKHFDKISGAGEHLNRKTALHAWAKKIGVCKSPVEGKGNDQFCNVAALTRFC